MASSPVFVLTALAVFLLLTSLWHGWASGLPRMVIELGAFVAASLAAWTLYPAVAFWLRPFLNAPIPVLSVLAGVLIGFTVVILCKLIALIFVKKTKHYPSPLKLVFGACGALLGFLEGLLIVTACAVGIRAGGMVAEAQLADPPNPDGAKPNPIAAAVIDLKKSMDQSWVGVAVKAVDPIPPEIYSNLKKFNIVIRNPDAMDRFISFPATRELFAEPKLRALIDNPKVREIVSERRFGRLAGNEEVLTAAGDPEVWAKISQFPWGEALTYAVPDEPVEAGGTR